MTIVRIGAGAGFADDRIEPAAELAEHGDLDYLVFECLAERTIATAQRDRRADPTGGYNEWLADRMAAVLPYVHRRRTRILTNMGAANPIAGAHVVADVARVLGIRGLRIAAVTGDDVLEQVAAKDLPLLEQQASLLSLGDSIVSANAYLGIEPLLSALELDVDVVITGRVADPSLFLAPLVHEFGWATDDWDRLGAGTVAGHLLECAGHVTGGYFADTRVKPVANLARLGFPLAEVNSDGSVVITKVAGTGGQVSVATTAEQLLYEVHDPAAYVTPDVIADFSGVELEQIGEDRVSVTGARGRARPDALKVSVGYREGWVGVGEISYAGPNAVARGRLALDIVRERLTLVGLTASEVRFDLIGVDAVHRGLSDVAAGEPAEVRVRVAARTPDQHSARRVGLEVTSLWLNGPAGGGGASRGATEQISVVSVLLPRLDVCAEITVVES